MYDIIVDEEEDSLINIDRLCKDNQVSYTLNYNDGENSYELELFSSSKEEQHKFDGEYGSLCLLYKEIQIFFGDKCVGGS